MTTPTDLRARLDALEASKSWDGFHSHLDEFKAALMQAWRSGELRNALVDAERWQWLRENCGFSGSGDHTGAQVIFYYPADAKGRYGIAYTGPKQRVGIMALDDAIGTARARCGDGESPPQADA